MLFDGKRGKWIWRFCLILYSGIMLWLMFFRFRSGVWEDSSNYWEHVRTQYNIVPLRMIRGYWLVLTNPANYNGWPLSYQIRSTIVNFGGNIGMLIPLGFLLAANFPKLRSLGKILLIVTVIIVTVELTQLFTLAGHCDIDDLILNLLGASMGFGLFSLVKRIEIQRAI